MVSMMDQTGSLQHNIVIITQLVLLQLNKHVTTSFDILTLIITTLQLIGTNNYEGRANRRMCTCLPCECIKLSCGGCIYYEKIDLINGFPNFHRCIISTPNHNLPSSLVNKRSILLHSKQCQDSNKYLCNGTFIKCQMNLFCMVFLLLFQHYQYRRRTCDTNVFKNLRENYFLGPQKIVLSFLAIFLLNLAVGPQNKLVIY